MKFNIKTEFCWRKCFKLILRRLNLTQLLKERRSCTQEKSQTPVAWTLTTHLTEQPGLKTLPKLLILTAGYWIGCRELKAITAQISRPAISWEDKNSLSDWVRTVQLSRETRTSCTQSVHKMRFPHHPDPRARLDWDRLTVECWPPARVRIVRGLYLAMLPLDRAPLKMAQGLTVLQRVHGEWSLNQLNLRIKTNMQKPCNNPRSCIKRSK